jgi:tRNA nucleotidyltransferase/poly(A) polymerase
MVELAEELLAGEEAWLVGGAVRDRLLGRPVVDVDVACREPEQAAKAYGRRARAPTFPLSERWGAWRVVLDGGATTVDFTELRGRIEDDLATRDFTVNAIAAPLSGGEPVDPFRGRADLDGRTLRAVSPSVFVDDPLRLLRAVRLEDELGFRMDPETERQARAHAALVVRPAGERILDELLRLSPNGWRRLDELGLLEPLGGSLERIDRASSAELLLVAALGQNVKQLPISNRLRRLAETVLRAQPPADGSPRAIHRFRRETEPWSLEALALLGAEGYADALREARRNEPAEPLLRGDELGLPGGPEIGRLLELVEEERAAGTIRTREEALELVRRHRERAG